MPNQIGEVWLGTIWIQEVAAARTHKESRLSRRDPKTMIKPH